MERVAKKTSAFAVVMAMAVLAVMATTSTAQRTGQDFVNAHNDARAAVGVGPVSWDTKLADFAQSYANTRKGDCSMTHSNNGVYG
ncbi:hypothetical protein GUJ93_ZPchr0007g5820 [Zizania palustris]|nr:hypothetical protein GUJ93_ZPchr0007g5820 [Zizania palustris]